VGWVFLGGSGLHSSITRHGKAEIHSANQWMATLDFTLELIAMDCSGRNPGVWSLA